MLPVDVKSDHPHPAWYWTEGENDIPQFVEETQRYLKEAYAAEDNHLQQAHHWNKQKYDQKGHRETFSFGDQVLLYVPVVTTG